MPAELVERTSLIGPEGYVGERIAALKESGVTTLNVDADRDRPRGPGPPHREGPDLAASR